MEHTIELAACTETLLNEIANGATRKAVAQTYRLAMQSRQVTDWPRVNAAIIARWSVSGLTWVKKQAWSGQCFEIRPAAAASDPHVDSTGKLPTRV